MHPCRMGLSKCHSRLGDVSDYLGMADRGPGGDPNEPQVRAVLRIQHPAPRSRCRVRTPIMFRSRLPSLLILALTLAASVSSEISVAQTPAQMAVLVTGASTGIGRKITERLASEGYFVYAGARKDVDLKALSSIKNVRGIRLDVTQGEDIAAAVKTITQEG